MTEDKAVVLTFTEPISDRRYKVEQLTPAMLEEIAQHIYNNPRLTERITELVDVALTEMFPELEREQDEYGNYEIKVVLSIYDNRTNAAHSDTMIVRSSDLASAEDEALYVWKRMNEWEDEFGEIVVELSEWV